MPPIAVDVVISWLAAAAIAIYLLALRRPGRPRSPLESKLLFLLLCLGSLFAIRGFFWIYGGAPLKVLTFIPATLLPLGATLFVESLQRRHAPLALKVFVLVGSLLVFGANLIVGEAGRWYFFRGLTSFMIVTFLWLFWMVLRRDRDTLSPAENGTIDGLSVAIVLAILVSLSDFQLRPDWLHLRLGGLGGLLFIYTCVRLVRSGERAVVREVGAMLLTTVALAASMRLLVDDADATTWVEASALALGFVVFFAIIDRLNSLARLERGHGLRHWLVGASLDSIEDLLGSLKDLPAAERHLVLDESGSELAGFDGPLMATVFDAARPVWSLAQLRTARPRNDLDPMAVEQLEALLESYGMGQVTLVSRTPCRFLLLSLPDVASAREWEQDLLIVQKIALSLDREKG